MRILWKSEEGVGDCLLWSVAEGLAGKWVGKVEEFDPFDINGGGQSLTKGC